ncbi:MAG: chemotaxis protein CheA [Deltaproteobacteria bacterium]
MTEFKDINEFLAEAEEIISELSDTLSKLSEGINAGRVDPDTLNSIFRSAHTLKGISGMFGFADMATLTHKMEDILDSVRMGRLPVNHDIVNIMFEAVDLINEMIVAKGKGEEVGHDKVDAIIARLNRIGESPSSLSVVSTYSEDTDIDKGILGVLTEYEEHRLQQNMKAGNTIFLAGVEFSIAAFDDGLVELTDFLKSIGEVIATLPSTGDSKDTLHFDILFGTQKDAAYIEEMLKGRNLTVRRVKGLSVPVPQAESARDITDSQLSLEARTEETTLRSMSNTVRVDIRRLDNIMNTVGELSQLKASISQIADRLRIEMGFKGLAIELSKIDKNLEKRLKELQDNMIEVRMVPVNQLFDKLMRAIRKLSREIGKEVELITSGGDTELDKLIIEDLADPLMHIIRNAIDHGIETPAEREKAGKPRAGTINLMAYPKGNHVAIEVEDDGAGMNMEVIRKKAVDRMLVDEAASHALSKEEVLEFIFLPGFSTKKEVSEVSGRGVGMDVVKKNISRISGAIDIDTEQGKGTRIILTLPITLAIIQALIITAGARKYAIPSGSVLEILNIRQGDIKTMERKEVVYLRDRTIPVLRLEQFFYRGTAARQEGERYGVVVGLAESLLCILVDSIVEQQDIVIKSLGKLLKVTGIAGATDIGDMGTFLVVDVAGIVAAATRGAGKRAA